MFENNGGMHGVRSKISLDHDCIKRPLLYVWSIFLHGLCEDMVE